MTPSVVWGIGAGLIIAAIDTLAVFLAGRPGADAEMIDLIDFMANVVLYTMVGLRVGKLTGVVREAAEAGVIAAVLVGAIAIAVAQYVRISPNAPDGIQGIIGILAFNIALGGVLAVIGGWIGSRAYGNEGGL